MTNVKLVKRTIASNIKPDWEELCNECSTMAKKVGWSKEDSRNLLKKIRKESKINKLY